MGAIPTALALAVAGPLWQLRHATLNAVELGVRLQVSRLNASRLAPRLAALVVLADLNPLLNMFREVFRSALTHGPDVTEEPPLSAYARNAALVEGATAVAAEDEVLDVVVSAALIVMVDVGSLVSSTLIAV